VRRPDGTVVDSPVVTYGATLQYAFLKLGSRAIEFAYKSRVKSTRDGLGRYGYAGEQYGIATIIGLVGVRCYVPLRALDAVVGTLEREGGHFVFYDMEKISDEP